MGKVIKFVLKTKKQREDDKLKKQFEEAKKRLLKEAENLDW